MNALTPENLNEYAVKWTAYLYIQICNNTEKIRIKNFVGGETITSPKGIDHASDDINEIMMNSDHQNSPNSTQIMLQLLMQI